MLKQHWKGQIIFLAPDLKDGMRMLRVKYLNYQKNLRKIHMHTWKSLKSLCSKEMTTQSVLYNREADQNWKVHTGNIHP